MQPLSPIVGCGAPQPQRVAQIQKPPSLLGTATESMNQAPARQVELPQPLGYLIIGMNAVNDDRQPMLPGQLKLGFEQCPLLRQRRLESCVDPTLADGDQSVVAPQFLRQRLQITIPMGIDEVRMQPEGYGDALTRAERQNVLPTSARRARHHEATDAGRTGSFENGPAVGVKAVEIQMTVSVEKGRVNKGRVEKGRVERHD